MTAQLWHYTLAGKQQPAITLQQLQQLATNGTLAPTDLVWTQGMPQWQPASFIPELAFQQPATPLPTDQPEPPLGETNKQEDHETPQTDTPPDEPQPIRPHDDYTEDDGSPARRYKRTKSNRQPRSRRRNRSTIPPQTTRKEIWLGFGIGGGILFLLILGVILGYLLGFGSVTKKAVARPNIQPREGGRVEVVNMNWGKGGLKNKQWRPILQPPVGSVVREARIPNDAVIKQSFKLVTGNHYTFTLEAPVQNFFRPIVELKDPQGKQVALPFKTRNGVIRVSYLCLKSGTYTFHAAGKRGRRDKQLPNYRLFVWADPLETKQLVRGQLTVNAPIQGHETKLYGLRLEKGEHYTISIRDNSEWYLHLKDSDGSAQALRNIGFKERFKWGFVPEKTQDYYLAIRDSKNQRAELELQIQQRPVTPLQFKNGQVVVKDQLAAYETKEYSIDLEAGQTYRIELSSPKSTKAFVQYIDPTSGRSVGGTSNYQLSPPKTASYRFHIRPSFDLKGSFEFKITRLATK